MSSETFKETTLNLGSLLQAPLRIWTIATGTFTQLVRMKTFWFLLAFAPLIAGVSNLNIKMATEAAHLTQIKNVALSTIDTFGWVYAIVATALLIPRDIEDRTLYTILTKPVRKVEYLVGKLVGVLIVIGISIALMLACSMLFLYVKEVTTINSQVAIMKDDTRLTESDIEEQVNMIRAVRANGELGVAALGSLLKSSVVAALTILISTFASSSLFSIISSMFIYMIGHFHAMIVGSWMDLSGDNPIVSVFLKVYRLLIPNFNLFSINEGITSGGAAVESLVWMMVGLTAVYLFVYLLISSIIFLYKEF